MRLSPVCPWPFCCGRTWHTPTACAGRVRFVSGCHKAVRNLPRAHAVQLWICTRSRNWPLSAR